MLSSVTNGQSVGCGHAVVIPTFCNLANSEQLRRQSMDYAFRNTLTRVLLVLSVLALFTGIVWAQGSGELSGLVTDPQGAVVAGAEVKLTNPATGDVRTTITSGAGIYHFAALPVGNYTLEVAPKGFKSVRVQNVVVTVGA